MPNRREELLAALKDKQSGGVPHFNALLNKLEWWLWCVYDRATTFHLDLT